MPLLAHEPLVCAKCKAPLPQETFNTPDRTICPACQSPMLTATFPALFREIEHGHTGETLLVDTEASCFYHPQKRATIACDSCGRFLCALCDVEFTGQHLCPACIESGRKKEKLKDATSRRTLYDEIALLLALLAFIPPFIYISWCLAPTVLYLTIRHWKSPGSVVPRTSVRFVLAALIALLQIGIGITALIALIVAIRS